MTIIYDIFLICFAIVYVPVLVCRGKWHSGLWTRLGFFTADDLGLTSEKKRIWVHAVSVGEVLAIKKFLVKIRAQYPQHQIVVSTVTRTGFHVAHSVIAQGEAVVYAPLDLSFIVRKYIRIIQPVIFLNAETEIWPNLFMELCRRSIPVIQINGRLSDKAFSRYRRFQRLLAPAIKALTCCCMQTDLDAQRMILLGVEAGRVHAVGNMKFDDALSFQAQKISDPQDSAQTITLIAASTHPGEEKIILEILRDLKKQFSHLRLFLVPRHPERAESLMSLCQKMDFHAIKFSQLSAIPLSPQTIVIVDTIGQLRSLYRSADIVFVGKSLTVKGGQNIIEPALYAKPIIVGPFTENFRDIVRIFIDHQALIQVKDESELKEAIARLIQDPTLRVALGDKAQSVIACHQGATEKTFGFVKAFIGAT